MPIIPGTTDPVPSVEELLALGETIGYPLLIKAAAGGGGKGMEIVEGPEDAERAFETARRQGQSYFANPDVYVEKLIVDPRHVEVQVLADAHGNVIHLGERDCTIQRRHQKLVEETPSPAVDDELRERIGAIGVDAARAAGYRSAGTIEGLLTPDGEYFFMEMNTRIQVEHTVTEMVTGLDLVREQVRIALGEPLSVTQEEVALRGHAIECRINAEDASRGFLPAPGSSRRTASRAAPACASTPASRPAREVVAVYDPLVAKLIVHGVDREHARRRMLRALGEYVIEGPTTLIGFHRALLSHDCFVRGETCAGIVESLEIEPDAAPRHACGRRRACGRARADGRGGRAPLRGADRGARGAVARARAAAPRARARRRGGRERTRRGRLADAGNRALRRGLRGRRGRGRPAALHRRGDEDGERGARAPRRHGRRSLGHAGRGRSRTVR